MQDRVQQIDRRTFMAALAAGMAFPALKAVASPDDDIFQLALASGSAGKVISVNGPIEPETVGFTLLHEHLFIDFFANHTWPEQPGSLSYVVARQMQQNGWNLPVTEQEIRFFNKRDLTIDMIDDMRQGARQRSNYLIDDVDLMLDEISAFKAHGGRTIVDQTVIGLGRDGQRLKMFARKSDINIVMGAGWYRWPYQSLETRSMSLTALKRQLAQSLLTGADSNGVRAGIIGEIPLDSRSVVAPMEGKLLDNTIVRRKSLELRNWLLSLPVRERNAVPCEKIYHEFELRQLTAAAEVARLTGAPLSIHGVDPYIGYLKVLEDARVDPARVLLSHSHFMYEERDLLIAALESGVTLQADYTLQQYATKAPLNGKFEKALDGIAWAVRNGFTDQVTISTDICNKLGLKAYGGGGYATVFNYLIPGLVQRGVTEEQIRHIFVRNPRRILTWAAPRA
jgi:phosphotriesterase-related protein